MLCPSSRTGSETTFKSANGASFKLRSVLLFSFARLRSLPPAFFLSGAVLAFSLMLPLPRGGSIGALPSICPFWNLTGHPCPGCGLTRSFVCLAHGHFVDAFRWHPLGPLLFGGTLLYLVSTLAGWKWPFPNRIAVALIVSLLVCWSLRLGGVFPLPS